MTIVFSLENFCPHISNSCPHETFNFFRKRATQSCMAQPTIAIIQQKNRQQHIHILSSTAMKMLLLPADAQPSTTVGAAIDRFNVTCGHWKLCNCKGAHYAIWPTSL